ncbi:hypothetical protein HDU93_003617, partial [Gonapodya sp. JEL0774]
MPYDVLTVPQTGLAADPVFTWPDGRGKYSAIVFASELKYQYAAGFVTALTTGQLDALAAYETTFSVRRVVLNAEPSSSHGVAYANPLNASTSLPMNLTFNSRFASPVGILPTATVTTDTAYHIPGTIDNTTLVTPVAYFDPLPPLFTNRTLAAAVATLPGTTRSTLYVYLSSSTWSPASLLMAHVWFQWVTRGIYQGRRRVLLDTQVDDVFLSTAVTQTAVPYSYRSTVVDMRNLVEWQKDLNARLPNGSSFRLQLCYNGNGVSALADRARYFVDIDLATHVTQNYVKPLGTGTARWPKNFTSQWKDEVLRKDVLYGMFAAAHFTGTNLSYLVSFTHLNLNEAYSTDIVKEVVFNHRMASSSYLSLSGRSWFSPHSMVTPQVSGLFNGDMYKVLTAAGVTAVVGDNSRPEVVPANKYHPWRTTNGSANYEGFLVVPRQPTEIYFDTSTPDENIALYNAGHPGANWTWQRLLDYEANRLVVMMLALRQDPHMFHQANLRNADQPVVTVGTGKGRLGILQQWVEAATA